MIIPWEIVQKQIKEGCWRSRMDIKEELTNMMEDLLNVIQLAVPESHWRAARSKSLRIMNDTIRRLTGEEDGSD